MEGKVWACSLGQGFVEVGLAEQGLFVTLVLDLVDKYVLGPAEPAGHRDVKLLFERIVAALKND